ncbi:uncharacterized protein LOC110731935 [Chenopodium quinoa]|uniref:uncharacterized protein LOC110731935 n=1 Tax=Chenopodium quinoa TaxID=63459 RepID=UPI000B7702FB|nr:uncharacterized protein LOC110731935 [Chenopodium quinoa]
MGNMTINEYYSKFIELMRFAPKVVPTEALKAQRFEQAHLYGTKGRELEGNYSEEKRKPSGTFNGSEKKPKVEGNPSGNFNGKRDNKGNFERGNRNRGIGDKPKRTYFCKRCTKNHPGRDCEGNLVTCRYCQKLGHREYECYKKVSYEQSGKPQDEKNQPKQAEPSGFIPKSTPNNSGAAPKGRVFVMNSREAATSSDVVIGNFFICSMSTKVLFNSGASHSFISRSLVDRLKLESPVFFSLDIAIPSGKVVSCTKMHHGVPLVISKVEFPSDLIELDLQDLDVILGMDWLGKYKAQIDCEAQKVTLFGPGKVRVTYQREEKKSGLKIISALQLKKFVAKGNPLYLCSVQRIEEGDRDDGKNISVVNEFLDVFPQEIPGMPSVRDVEFTMDLVPGT